MIDFFKTLIAERIVIKIVGFIFAIGIIPVMIFVYGLGEEPSWVKKERHYLKHSYALTVQAPLKMFDLQKSIQELQRKAQIEFKKEIYNRALKQMKISYEWDIVEEKIQKVIIHTLDDELKRMDLKNIQEQSIYEDNLQFKIYGLYSIKNAVIDTILQDIYEKVNFKMMNVL